MQERLDFVTYGPVGRPGCGVLVSAYRGIPSACEREVTHMGTRWFAHDRAGYRVPVCAGHAYAVDDPHPLTAADRAELDARAAQLARALCGRRHEPTSQPLWTGPREARPADWVDSF